MSLTRVRTITLPDGSQPYAIDGRVYVTAFPQFTTVNMAEPVLADGEDVQSFQPRQFSVTLVGKVFEETTGKLRRFLQLLDTQTGLRNRRFYLNDDLYWFVRSEGARYTYPYPGVRHQFTSIELYFRMLDPFLRDAAGHLYRAW